jgi:hypothetical protein
MREEEKETKLTWCRYVDYCREQGLKMSDDLGSDGLPQKPQKQTQEEQQQQERLYRFSQLSSQLIDEICASQANVPGYKLKQSKSLLPRLQKEAKTAKVEKRKRDKKEELKRQANEKKTLRVSPWNCADGKKHIWASRGTVHGKARFYCTNEGCNRTTIVPPQDLGSQTATVIGKAKTRLQGLQPGSISHLPQLFDLFQPAIVK